MAKQVKWNDTNIELMEKPKRTKKITGTKFASILGFNSWSTPFQQWCEITRAYNQPFEDTVYTIAGKVIEPKVTDYLKDIYFSKDTVITPTDVYGENPFKVTYGDFFPQHKVLGGMWDALYKDGDKNAVIEIKTTKRSEDWLNANGEMESPIYYALQASLYAYLLGIDDVYMTVTFLKDEDYLDPESFVPNASNTNIEHFKVSERFPMFDEYIQYVLDWHEKYIVTGISPDYDSSRDSEYLRALSTNEKKIEDTSDVYLQELVKNLDELYPLLEEKKNELKEIEKPIKDIQNELKEIMTTKFRQGDTDVRITSSTKVYTLSKSSRDSVDLNKLKEDGLNQYITTTEIFTLRIKENK